jgi:hypothetical protein
MSQPDIKWHTRICDGCGDFLNTYSEPAVCAAGNGLGEDIHEFEKSKKDDTYCEHALHFQCAKCNDDKEKKDREAYEQAEAAAATSGSGSGSGVQAGIS